MGDGFDTVAGVVLEAAGGALGARAVAGSGGGGGPKVKTSPSRVNLLDEALCRRRRSPSTSIFDMALPRLEKVKDILLSYVQADL